MVLVFDIIKKYYGALHLLFSLETVFYKYFGATHLLTVFTNIAELVTL
jgi:hypothetical protein